MEKNLNPESKFSALAPFLKDARVKAGLQQKDVADALGYTSVQFVSNWERGLRAPPGKTLIRLAKMYKISIDDLYQILLEERISQTKKELQDMLFGRKSRAK